MSSGVWGECFQRKVGSIPPRGGSIPPGVGSKPQGDGEWGLPT